MRHITFLYPLIFLECPDPTPAGFEVQTPGEPEIAAGPVNRSQHVPRKFGGRGHGAGGSGRGPSAAGLQTRPPDFRPAPFKRTSTGGDRLPTDDDLFGTIWEGAPAQGMSGCSHLTEEDRRAVAHYLKIFSPRWRNEAHAS